MSENSTLDVSSIANSAVMAVDQQMRKNGVPFGERHAECRALLIPLIASAVADHYAALAREDLDIVLAATAA